MLLHTVAKMGNVVGGDEAISFASRSSLRSGGLPIRDGYALAVKGGFLKKIGSDVELTRLGSDALALCSEDEPSTGVRRLFISVLLLNDPPPWVAFWQGDPTSLELVLPDADRDALSSAGLFPASKNGDLLTSAWWSALEIVPVPQETQAQRKMIGDAGEELSFEYERH